MPRRAQINPFEDRDREIRRLKDDLYVTRVALIELMQPEARAILESYREVSTTQEWIRWPDEAAEKITALCSGITQRIYEGYVYEERAKCPLCGEGPQSFYDGHSGFKLPEGLRRHLVGYGNSHECSIFGAARALGREYYRSTQERPEPGPNWEALKKVLGPGQSAPR